MPSFSHRVLLRDQERRGTLLFSPYLDVINVQYSMNKHDLFSFFPSLFPQLYLTDDQHSFFSLFSPLSLAVYSNHYILAFFIENELDVLPRGYIRWHQNLTTSTLSAAITRSFRCAPADSHSRQWSETKTNRGWSSPARGEKQFVSFPLAKFVHFVTFSFVVQVRLLAFRFEHVEANRTD